MQTYEVKRIATDVLKETIAQKDCPNCKAETTFIKVEVWPEAEGEESSVKWRCLNCLKLFIERLQAD